MTIAPDIAAVAKHWGLDPKLLQAVVTAEGDIVKAVRFSVPTVTSRAQALEILARSATHAMSDYIHHTTPAGFVAFWADRWAPQGVANDPTELNKNWPANVTSLWLKP